MIPLPDIFLRRPLAHRGLHALKDGRPENSLAAFRAAIEHGYGIELDLQLSSDGVAMSFHDYQLERLTGEHGFVRELTRAQLVGLTLTGSQEHVPDLDQVLELVAGRTALLIELKDQDGALGPSNLGALEASVADSLRGYDGPVALMSFNPHTVAELARVCPDHARGLVTCAFDPVEWPFLTPEGREPLRRMEGFAPADASFISHDVRDLEAPAVAAIKEAGHPVLCWTVRTAMAEARARRIAANITFEGYLPAA